MQKLVKNLPLLCVLIVFAIGYVVMIVEDMKPKQVSPPAVDTLVVFIYHHRNDCTWYYGKRTLLKLGFIHEVVRYDLMVQHPPDSAFKWAGSPDTVTQRKAKFR